MLHKKTLPSNNGEPPKGGSPKRMPPKGEPPKGTPPKGEPPKGDMRMPNCKRTQVQWEALQKDEDFASRCQAGRRVQLRGYSYLVCHLGRRRPRLVHMLAPVPPCNAW